MYRNHQRPLLETFSQNAVVDVTSQTGVIYLVVNFGDRYQLAILTSRHKKIRPNFGRHDHYTLLHEVSCKKVGSVPDLPSDLLSQIQRALLRSERKQKAIRKLFLLFNPVGITWTSLSATTRIRRSTKE